MLYHSPQRDRISTLDNGREGEIDEERRRTSTGMTLDSGCGGRGES